MIFHILEIPLDRPVPPMDALMVQLLMEDGIDVHAEGRDARTEEALELLLAHQSALDEPTIEAACVDFRAFVETQEGQRRDRAKLAMDNSDDSLGCEGLIYASSIFGYGGLSGAGLIGRLWEFARTFNEGSEESVIRDSIVSALVDSIEDDGQIVCNPGKVHRLVCGVLQGRLAGVDNDDWVRLETAYREVTGPEVARLFFTPARQAMEGAEELRREIDGFLAENPRVRREVLVGLVEGYITETLDEEG
jgi:hypothetical protein